MGSVCSGGVQGQAEIHVAAPWFCGPKQMQREMRGCLRDPSAWGKYSHVVSETLLMGK